MNENERLQKELCTSRQELKQASVQIIKLAEEKTVVTTTMYDKIDQEREQYENEMKV